MKKIIISLFVLFASISGVYAWANNIENVFKIYSYKYDPLTEMYEPQASGSAVYIGNGKIVTNAHVLIDKKQKPYNYYEVCKTYSFRERPWCISVANLKHIDVERDLAYLSINSAWFELWSWVSWTINPITIWDSITVLWYPGTGWETITLSEWKISGYAEGYYKTDSDIDSGNSWWWVFDANEDFVGMPTLIVSDAANLWYIIGAEDILEFISEAQSSSSISTDISDFKDIWNDHRVKMKEEKLLKVPGMQIRNPSKYNFEVISYSATKSGTSEYFLKSSLWETYIELWNIHLLQSDVSFMDTWEGSESDEDYKIIKREISLWWKNLTLLAYIDLATQDIVMYFYSESSSFSIFGNMTESKQIIDALKMLISDTDILEQESASLQLQYKWYGLSPQEKLFSSNEVWSSTLINFTSLRWNEVELSFEVLWADSSFENIDGSYEDILDLYFAEWVDDEGYIILKSNLIKNSKGEIFILSKYDSPEGDSNYYTLNKYSSPRGVDGYYYAYINVNKEWDTITKDDLITFFDSLEFEWNDPVSVADQSSLKTVSQFFQ